MRLEPDIADQFDSVRCELALPAYGIDSWAARSPPRVRLMGFMRRRCRLLRTARSAPARAPSIAASSVASRSSKT